MRLNRPRSTRSPALSWRVHGRLIVLAIGMGMFNQLSGINAILYYLGDIFGAAGFSSLSANLQSIAIGATNLLATIVAMTLIDRTGQAPAADRIGRRGAGAGRCRCDHGLRIAGARCCCRC